MMRVFFDTNILLDVLLDRPGLVAESTAVILRCEAGSDSMFIAWHGLATAYYLLKRGRTEAEAMVEVDRIFSWARIADVDDGHAHKARLMGFGDFEGALQATSAEACGADWIVTRNTNDFSKSSIPAISPQEFVRRFPPV